MVIFSDILVQQARLLKLFQSFVDISYSNFLSRSQDYSVISDSSSEVESATLHIDNCRLLFKNTAQKTKIFISSESRVVCSSLEYFFRFRPLLRARPSHVSISATITVHTSRKDFESLEYCSRYRFQKGCSQQPLKEVLICDLWPKCCSFQNIHLNRRDDMDTTRLTTVESKDYGRDENVVA